MFKHQAPSDPAQGDLVAVGSNRRPGRRSAQVTTVAAVLAGVVLTGCSTGGSDSGKGSGKESGIGRSRSLEQDNAFKGTSGLPKSVQQVVDRLRPRSAYLSIPDDSGRLEDTKMVMGVDRLDRSVGAVVRLPKGVSASSVNMSVSARTDLGLRSDSSPSDLGKDAKGRRYFELRTAPAKCAEVPVLNVDGWRADSLPVPCPTKTASPIPSPSSTSTSRTSTPSPKTSFGRSTAKPSPSVRQPSTGTGGGLIGGDSGSTGASGGSTGQNTTGQNTTGQNTTGRNTTGGSTGGRRSHAMPAPSSPGRVLGSLL